MGTVVATPAESRRYLPTAIQVLAPEVVERIAAGEVVERPVSVVRELVDNALDAHARDIRVDVRGGGLRWMRVADDGVGIRADQVDLALRHHATSKIRELSDLAHVSSLGFRGEALPSIAAVCEMTLLTAAEDTAAVRLDLRYGEGTDRIFTARPRGTTVTVRNLFGNTPARLKFVGNARTESAQISHLLRRYALAHPDVRFHLTLDGHLSLNTSGLGLEHALGEVFGAALGRAMLALPPVQADGAIWAGYVSGRQATRSSRHHVTLLINGRCVGSRGLLSALEDGYRPLLPRGRHPVAFLSLTLPRDRVDVNVHPSKAEVKVHDESRIGATLKEAVRELLGRSIDAPSADISYALGPLQAELPHMIAESGPSWEEATGSRLRAMAVRGQIHGSLIMLEDRDGIYLIDQHRAHERAIYELLLRRHGEGRAGQLLLEPLHIELTQRQIERLEPRLPELAALGLTCEWFGGHSFLVRSVPVVPETAELPLVVDDLLDMATDDSSDWQHRLLTQVACRTATRRGKVLTISQCAELIEMLADTASPAACPHGSPIILHFSDHFLNRQFQW
ncbi:MAG TPA: DNA mismatch repair endonuclease MutL [Chloroflexota bacterium]